jgi:hypothetical protein
MVQSTQSKNGRGQALPSIAYACRRLFVVVSVVVVMIMCMIVVVLMSYMTDFGTFDIGLMLSFDSALCAFCDLSRALHAFLLSHSSPSDFIRIRDLTTGSARCGQRQAIL